MILWGLILIKVKIKMVDTKINFICLKRICRISLQKFDISAESWRGRADHEENQKYYGQKTSSEIQRVVLSGSFDSINEISYFIEFSLFDHPNHMYFFFLGIFWLSDGNDIA